jgi:hypothetical protein
MDMANREISGSLDQDPMETHKKMDLKLDSKGFFTTIFFNHVDRDIIFENGSYFF